MSNTTSTTDSIRFMRIKKMLLLSDDVEKMLKSRSFDNDDPIVNFCRMAADVAEDAFIFKNRLDRINYNLYTSTNKETETSISKVSLLNTTEVKSKKKSKKKRDPNAPKRPTPAFFLFAIANKERVKEMEENKEKTGNEIKKILGHMWKTGNPRGRRNHSLILTTQAYKIYKEAVR